MIVSHEHRFIFLRTEKTAGTSLSRALHDALGDKVISAKRETPGWARFSPIHYGALKRQIPDLFGLHPHASARQVRRILGRRIFDSYFKFAIERNPWERQVSLYGHREWKKNNKDLDFDRDIRSLLYRGTEYVRLNNWSIYAIGDSIVADRILRYETLAEDLRRLCTDLKFGHDLVMPQLRSYSAGRKHYSAYYTDKSRQLVANWYSREIEALGYEFETPAGDQPAVSACFCGN